MKKGKIEDVHGLPLFTDALLFVTAMKRLKQQQFEWMDSINIPSRLLVVNHSNYGSAIEDNRVFHHGIHGKEK